MKRSIPRPPALTHRPPTAALVHQGPVFAIWQWQQELYDGSSTTFEVLSRADTVLILPVTSDRYVLLANESQPGLAERLHTFGGRIEPGEDPETAARRELTEELGVRAERLELWASWQPLSKIDWAVYIFWAGGLAEDEPASPDAGEKISVARLPLDGLFGHDVVDRIDDAELLYRLGLAALSPTEHRAMERSLAKAVGERSGSDAD